MIQPPETFATARLRARIPRVGDAPLAFQAYANDPEVTRFLTWRPHERVETLAVFLLGSIVNWDLIPMNAISRVTVACQKSPSGVGCSTAAAAASERDSDC